MKAVRQFKLINSAGETYDLMDVNHYFNEPSGLGFSADNRYTRVANKFSPYQNRARQGIISGTMVFHVRAYEEYRKFILFCQKEPLTLIYTTDRENRAKVLLTDVEKTEISHNNSRLLCKVMFTMLGMWYRVVAASNDGSIDGGKVYNYIYDYTYADEIPGVVNIESDTQCESPCIITIYGPAVNPVWRHYLNGQLMEEGAVDATIAQDRRLVIDTTSTPFRIVEVDAAGNVYADRYQDSDFSKERFVYLGAGRNRFAVGSDTTTPAVTVEARLEYKTI